MRIGLAFVPFAVAAIIVTALLPSIRSRIAAGPVLAAGLLLAAGGLARLGLLSPSSGYTGGVLPTMLLLGSGGTVVMITAGDVATAGVTDDSGVAGALVNSAQQIGAAFGTAVLGAVMLAVAHRADTGEPEPIVAAVAGHAHGGLVGAVIVTVAAIAVLAVRTPGLPGSP